MAESHKVLLVDDHPGIRRVLKECLDRTGVLRAVGEVSRSADLPWALRTFHPDLVILDLELEQGFLATNAVPQIRALAPEARIVVYSAHSDFQTVTHLLDLGVAGYLLKTDGISFVIGALQEIAAGARRFSPDLTPILAEGNWPNKSLNLAERGVLQMLADGMSTKRIGLEMHVAERTVREHVGKAMHKLGATSWPQAIALAIRKKVIR